MFVFFICHMKIKEILPIQYYFVFFTSLNYFIIAAF